MLISSPTYHPTVNIDNNEPKEYIKYLRVYSQIQHINNKTAKNAGILTKLRHYIDFNMLKQIYYTFKYPYLSCVIIDSLLLGAVPVILN